MCALVRALYARHGDKLEGEYAATAALRRRMVTRGRILAERAGFTIDCEKGDRSASLLDCLFLQLLVWELAPRAVVEIGTWFGTTAAIMAMAAGEGTRVDTCDTTNTYVADTELADRIHVAHAHSDGWTEGLRSEGKRYDLAFVDATLTRVTAEHVARLFREEVAFATHDFVRGGSGSSAKGVQAVALMSRALAHRDVVVVAPDPTIYRVGCDVGAKLRVNSSTAVVIERGLLERILHPGAERGTVPRRPAGERSGTPGGDPGSLGT